MADVMVGKSLNDQLATLEDRTQVYGLAGSDTLKSNGKNEILLVGGSGDDILQMTGGNGTLSGGAGSDTFELNYSATQKISAVIEDIDPDNDKIIITYDGETLPQLSYSISGGDVVWTDDKGYFNVTLKGSSDSSDYYEGTAHEFIWEVLRLVNQERENQGLPALTLSQGLVDGAQIRSAEQIELYGHKRPDGTDCWTAVTKSYLGMGENAYKSPSSPEAAMEGWMNSEGHRANILNSSFKKIGIGYTYDDQAEWKHYWVQMFGGNLTYPDTLSTSAILTASITTRNGALPTSDTPGGGGGDTVTTPSGNSGVVIDNDNPNTLISGTNYADLIDNSGNYATINTYAGNDTVSNWGDTIKIDTGSGDDSIYSYNYYGTINAGTGNDTVSLNSSAHDNIIQYANGDGNDIIYNLGTNNTLSISGGSYSTQTSGSDILVQVGSGTITLAGSTSANIIGTKTTTNTTPSANNHVYTGGNGVISNYAGEQIIVGMLPKEWMFYGNDFYYGSNTGTLVVQNVKDKIIDLRDGNGNSFVKAYKATYSGTINGKGLAGFEYIVGSDYGGDAIYAGDGGSSLWGGAGNYSDTLIGGAATDVFVTGKSQGNDVINNASIADVVWLRDVNFSDIKYTASSNGVIGMEFNTGNTLLVGSTSNVSAIFQFADGSSRRYNLATKSWQST